MSGRLGHGVVTRLLNEEAIRDKVKTEILLPVALGIRPAGLIVLPVDFPGSQGMGEEIDRRFAARYRTGASPGAGLLGLGERLRNLARRAVMDTLSYRTVLIEEAYEEVVLESDVYRAHLGWARELGLLAVHQKLRPSIGALFVVGGDFDVRRLDRLAAMRGEIRRRFRDSLRERAARPGGQLPPGPLGITDFAFPEEADGAYLRHLGAILGYPACCAGAYAADRQRGATAEERAARQLAELDAQGGRPDPYAYFTRDFFPCTPRCAAAAALGRATHAALRELDPRLGEEYLRGLEGNVQAVREYPERLRLAAERMRRRWG